jgi:hypothetical protein
LEEKARGPEKKLDKKMFLVKTTIFIHALHVSPKVMQRDYLLTITAKLRFL